MEPSLRKVTAPINRFEILSSVVQVSQVLTNLETIIEVILDNALYLCGAERCILMLEDTATGQLQFRAGRNLDHQDLVKEQFQASRSILVECFSHQVSVLTSNATQDPRFQHAHSVQKAQLRSVLCVPLIHTQSKKSFGVLYLDNSIQNGIFTPEDKAFLEVFTQQLVHQLIQKQYAEENHRLKQLFTRYLDSEVVATILQRTDIQLQAFRTEGTVLFLDIRNFSHIVDHNEPEETLAILNNIFQPIEEIIIDFRGVVLSFLGDGLLAAFNILPGNPCPKNLAVQCGLEILEYTAKNFSVEIGIGLASGPLTVGDIGSEKRREFTVIGAPVNTASRLEQQTKNHPYPLLLDGITKAECPDFTMRKVGSIVLKGQSAETEVWAPESPYNSKSQGF